MSTRLLPGIHRLQARIEALLASGPMRARVAQRILEAEGWSPDQIREAKRRTVLVRGTMEARAWWHALERPVRRRQVRAEGVAKRAAKKAAPVTAVLAFPLPAKVTTGRCKRHGFTTTRLVGGRRECWLCAEQGEQEVATGGAR